jgi:hypothetical protein
MAHAEPFAWWESRLEGAPGVRCLRVGTRAALFCEGGQQLFELNPTAEAIWTGLAAGKTPRAVADELEALGATAADARAFVSGSAEAWVLAGQLLPAGIAERLAGAPDAELHLRLAGRERHDRPLGGR